MFWNNTTICIKQRSRILCHIYRAFCHKSSVNQQIYKIIDMHKIYLTPLHKFQQTSWHGMSKEFL
jgi:hypothetical protein